MATTIMSYIGFLPFRVYIGGYKRIMEKNMETTITSYMNYSLNSLKGLYGGLYRGLL